MRHGKGQGRAAERDIHLIRIVNTVVVDYSGEAGASAKIRIYRDGHSGCAGVVAAVQGDVIGDADGAVIVVDGSALGDADGCQTGGGGGDAGGRVSHSGLAAADFCATGNIFNVKGCISDGSGIALIEQGHSAVGQLTQAGISVMAAAVYAVGVVPAYGAVVLYQANENLTCGTIACWCGKQDCSLTVNLLRINHCIDLAGSRIADAGDSLLAAPGFAVVGGVVVAAVAGEHIDGAVGLNQSGLAGLGAHVGAAGPGLTAVIRIDDAGVAVGGDIGIAGVQNTLCPILQSNDQTGAGANAVELIVAVLHLAVQHGGGRPSLAAVGAGGQIKITGGQDGISAVREKHIADAGSVIIEVEILIYGVVSNLRAAGGVDVGIAVRAVVAHIVAIAGTAVVAQQQMAAAVVACTGLCVGNPSATGIKIDQHVNCLAVCGKAGVNKSGGTSIVAIAIVAQIVGESIVPGRAFVGGIGNNGIQTVAVGGIIPPCITSGNDGAII